jgi:hypothetical protein
MKFLKEQRGLLALITALLIFGLNSPLIRFLWPGEKDPGLVPGSYLSLLVLACVIYFLGVGVAWMAYEFDFWPIDKNYDQLETDFHELTPIHKILCAFIPFFLLLAWFLVALMVAIKILS